MEYIVQINNGEKMVVGLMLDGTVEFGEGITPTEAAKQFWVELGDLMTQPLASTK